MTKRPASDYGRVTVTAMANILAAVVDAMRSAGVPGEAISLFLDDLNRRNAETLPETPAAVMADILHAIRKAVPTND